MRAVYSDTSDMRRCRQRDDALLMPRRAARVRGEPPRLPSHAVGVALLVYATMSPRRGCRRFSR